MVYKSVVFLDNKRPLIQLPSVFPNSTLKKALLYFVVDNPRADGVVLVHQNGAFHYRGTIADVKKEYGVAQ